MHYQFQFTRPERSATVSFCSSIRCVKKILVDIQNLAAKSKSIGNIFKVINNIADQTNLPVLNAAMDTLA
jgi:hypothetical protein